MMYKFRSFVFVSDRIENFDGIDRVIDRHHCGIHQTINEFDVIYFQIHFKDVPNMEYVRI